MKQHQNSGRPTTNISVSRLTSSMWSIQVHDRLVCRRIFLPAQTLAMWAQAIVFDRRLSAGVQCDRRELWRQYMHYLHDSRKKLWQKATGWCVAESCKKLHDLLAGTVLAQQSGDRHVGLQSVDGPACTTGVLQRSLCTCLQY